jgi:transposase-like protein
LFFKGFSLKEAIMDDLDKFCCPHKNCPKHGVRGEKNIRVRDVYGPNNTRLLYCLICKQRFSERRGTVLFDSRLPEETAIAILEHVVEGCGMRKTGRLLKVDPATVSRYTKLAGEHAEQIHDELVDFSPEHRGSPVRRKVGLCAKETKTLRRKQPG